MYQYLIIFYMAVLAISLIYLLVTAWITRNKLQVSQNKARLNTRQSLPLISILKPLKGLDDNLEENLRSFFQLDYPNYEIIFGLQSYSDPAVEVAAKIIEEYDHIQAKIVTDPHKIGLNPKINNLYNMMPYAKGEYILISDSNTAVTPSFLSNMMLEFEDQAVGLVTATIRGTGEKSIASAMENLHLNTFVSPSVFVAEVLTTIPVVIGKAILISKDLLEKVGGFKALKDYLAEDYLLGLKVKEVGYKHKCAPVFIDNLNQNWTFERFLNRHSRWAKIRRHMHLSYYLLESLSNPITLSFVLGILLFNWIGVIQFFITIFLKYVHDIYLLRLFKKRIRIKHLALIPVKDLLIGLLWIIPFFRSNLSWRDNKFKIKKRSYIVLAS